MGIKSRNIMFGNVIRNGLFMVITLATVSGFTYAASSMTLLNLSEWTDRSSVSSWDVIPQDVKSAFYDEMRRVIKKYNNQDIRGESYTSCVKSGSYRIKYRREFGQMKTYILNVYKT